MKRVFLMLGVAALLSLSACDCKKECSNNQEGDQAAVVMENIMNRKSVRSYDGTAIGDDTIQALLKAAMAAPSARDVRPWSFVVLKDKSNYETIFEGNMNMEKFMQSGVVIVVCADTTCLKRGSTEGEREHNTMWRDDMGAVAENLLLAAEAYGLGAVWTSCYPHYDRMAPIHAALELPAEVVPYCVIPVGHHDGTTQPKDKWDESRIHNERW